MPDTSAELRNRCGDAKPGSICAELRRSTAAAAVAGAFTLVLPVDLLNELEETVAESAHLARAITREQIDAFLDILWTRAEALPSVPVPQSSVTRDQEDDYLLAAAAIADVDVLVTGDRDLFALRGLLKRPAMLTAAEFVDLIAPPAGPQP